MRKTVGVLVMDHIAVGLVEGNKMLAPPRLYPEQGSSSDALLALPAENIGDRIKQEIDAVAQGHKIDAIGLGFPGVIRNGVIEDSPNLHQVKGYRLQTALSAARPGGASVPVRVFNDADAMAAGIAASRDKLHKLIRVWTLGNGVGFGRYPWTEGVWEGGHSVVTLDLKETLCGCGGRGHLEGILGHRSMRLRFLDLEPEEVFASAASGSDQRCSDFVTLCHRALAAATATSIHMDGPGHFYITGPNAKFIDIGLLDRIVQEMVKMSPLQGSRFEVIPTSDEVGIIGAAINALAAVAA
jgi:glucokinase